VNARARWADMIAIRAVQSSVVVLMAGLAMMMLSLVHAGLSEITRASFYTAAPNIAGPGSGIAPQLFNTVYVLVLTLLICMPFGLLAGIYFAEYAGNGRAANLVRRATETLATLPSIVVGLFGYALFVSATHSNPSRLAAGLSLVVINLPYAVRVSEDALRAVPARVREGSLALGATQWQTITRVLIPAALPSLVTGVILMAGRVFGEAAAVLFTGSAGAITGHANFNLNPFAPGDTLAVDLYIFRIQAEPSAVPDASQYADGVAAFLVIIVMLFNIVARLSGRRLVNRLHGTV